MLKYFAHKVIFNSSISIWSTNHNFLLFILLLNPQRNLNLHISTSRKKAKLCLPLGVPDHYFKLLKKERSLNNFWVRPILNLRKLKKNSLWRSIFWRASSFRSMMFCLGHGHALLLACPSTWYLLFQKLFIWKGFNNLERPHEQQ